MRRSHRNSLAVGGARNKLGTTVENTRGIVNCGRSKSRDMHDLLLLMCDDLRIAYGLSVVLSWMPTAVNIAADAISRSSLEQHLPVWTGRVQNNTVTYNYMRY